MKKAALYGVLAALVMLPGLGAEPHRIAEAGVDLGAGFANNLVTLGDVFNIRRTVVIDFTKISVADMVLQGFAEGEAFFNLNLGALSFGFFAGLESSGYFRASDALLRFIKEGNDRSRLLEGTLEAGGSAFLEAGIRAGFPVKRLRFNTALAVFIPLVYMPPPEVSYRIDTSGTGGEIVLSAIQIDMYSAVPLNESLSFPPGSLPLGADLGVEAVYSLLPQLDLGLAVDHIPLLPARLRHLTRLESTGVSYDLNDMFGFLSGGGFNLPDIPDMNTSYSEDESRWVFRPLRFDFFAEYRPVGVDLFVIRSLAGFSLFTVYGYNRACFNAGLEGQINILKGFSLRVSTAYRERIWQQGLSLMFNFRVLELHARASLRGTDFPGSFSGKGLGLSLGLRVGY